MAPEQPKRRKVGDGTPPAGRGAAALTAGKKDTDATPVNRSMANLAQSKGIHPRIQQAKNFAVAQAQQEGSTGNFKIFDSPFGNFLVPVIPSRADFSG